MIQADDQYNEVMIMKIRKMKKLGMTVIALMLCVLMAGMEPIRALGASSSEVYVSEVKVGMGETSEEAAKELLAEGYTILTDADGSYADLNYKAGTNSGMKKGPTQRIVYIGYKTTTNPKDAITDLAVMNMNGGYSTEDYNVLMAKHMDGEIKPFVDRFIATLNEYRENYKKPADSLGHKRADFYRKMLNKLTDDDTGGQPLGDLLLNLTKYEMGDDLYNTQSAAEKKKHCDILTLLMQGNGKAILLLETLLTKASDSGDDTWVDRFLKTSADELKAQVKKDNPHLTTEADILAEMDKQYNDTARKILEKWDTLTEAMDAYDDTLNEIVNTELTLEKEVTDKIENMDADNPTKEDVKAVADVVKKNTELADQVMKAETATVIDFLDSIEYNNGSMLEFFERDKSELSGEGIRELYPIAAALSPGQIAGLDFLSIVDLFSMALIGEEGLEKVNIDETQPASVFQDVDREIYKPGGVALTNKALRDEKSKSDKESEKDFELSPLGIALWTLTAASGLVVLTTVLVTQKYIIPAITSNLTKLDNLMYNLQNPLGWLKKLYTKVDERGEFWNGSEELFEKYWDEVVELQEWADEKAAAIASLTTKSKICYWLGVGFTVAFALLAAWSIYTTVTEMMDYYKVSFVAIPKYMVDSADITKTVDGKEVMVKNETAYYKVVTCNRKDADNGTEHTNFKILGDASDLNGDVGKQWLALYSVKYKNGKPILADSFKVVKGTTDLPGGYEIGIHRFGEGAAFNLTSKSFCYNDKPDGTYVYFKNAKDTVAVLTGEEKSTSGSIFSAGSLAIGGGIGILVGGGIAALIMTAASKKKKKEAVPA